MAYKQKLPKIKEKKEKSKEEYYKYMVKVYESEQGIKLSEPEKEDLWDNIYFDKEKNDWEVGN
jgi:hypothetical protein